MSDFTRSLDRDKFVPSFYTELLEMEALYKELLPVWGIEPGVRV